ncbi:MAG: ribonuclease HI [Elusimicrobiota bacterium]|jgi:ribonuclease HI
MSDILIYTDGACSGNPGPGGWGAIVVVGTQVRELGGGEPRTTNNRMEMTAAIAALRFIQDADGRIDLYTDSTYLIKGMTAWLAGWKRKGWVRIDGSEISNRDLWEQLDVLAQARKPGLHWHYVRGHKGQEANTRCAAIAVECSKLRKPHLYHGPILGYDVCLIAPQKEEIPAAKPRVPGQKKGGWYLSLLDGKLEKHAVWAQCQARVHGQPALFKKVSSQEEEAQILKKWGLG